MTYEEFTRSEAARRRYWARSFVGWRVIGEAEPNRGHCAVAELENAGRLSGIVTQNVDGLQQVAGATSVIELHGNLAAVVCLSCQALTARVELDRRLRSLNPRWEAALGATRPDGDAVVADEAVAAFNVADCSSCGGVLKPDVVFFGESVPKARVQQCFAILESSAVLLVVGSSLQVMSGFRFVLRASKIGIPVVIVNQGETRGDQLATVRIDAPLGGSLPQMAEQLIAS